MGQAIGLIRLVPCAELENVERIDGKGGRGERQTDRQEEKETGPPVPRATLHPGSFLSWACIPYSPT